MLLDGGLIATVTSSSLRFALLITAASGFLAAYTFLARGGVFANAQTGNVILLALDLAHGSWRQASVEPSPPGGPECLRAGCRRR